MLGHVHERSTPLRQGDEPPAPSPPRRDRTEDQQADAESPSSKSPRGCSRHSTSGSSRRSRANRCGIGERPTIGAPLAAGRTSDRAVWRTQSTSTKPGTASRLAAADRSMQTAGGPDKRRPYGVPTPHASGDLKSSQGPRRSLDVDARTGRRASRRPSCDRLRRGAAEPLKTGGPCPDTPATSTRIRRARRA